LSTTPVTGTGALASGAPAKDQTVTVYGRVPPQDTPGPGAYTDTVTATVTF
jgi:spore coat protein U-like protein